MVTAEDLGFSSLGFSGAETRIFESESSIDSLREARRLGFKLFGPAELMDKRIESVNTEYGDAWWMNEFDTDMGIALTPREVLFLPGFFSNVDLETKLTRKGIVIPDGYNGKIIRHIRDRNMLDSGFNELEALRSEMLESIAENKGRLSRYARICFGLGKRYGFEEMMGVWSDPKTEPNIITEAVRFIRKQEPVAYVASFAGLEYKCHFVMTPLDYKCRWIGVKAYKS